MITTDDIEVAKAKRKLANRPISEISPASISRELMDAIAHEIEPTEIAKCIRELITATRELKNGTVLPDTRAMESGVKLYLAYMIGLPVQRIENLNVNVDAETEEGLTDRLAKSPALRQSFRRVLSKAEGVSEGVVEA